MTCIVAPPDRIGLFFSAAEPEVRGRLGDAGKFRERRQVALPRPVRLNKFQRQFLRIRPTPSPMSPTRSERSGCMMIYNTTTDAASPAGVGAPHMAPNRPHLRWQRNIAFPRQHPPRWLLARPFDMGPPQIDSLQRPFILHGSVYPGGMCCREKRRCVRPRSVHYCLYVGMQRRFFCG